MERLPRQLSASPRIGPGMTSGESATRSGAAWTPATPPPPSSSGAAELCLASPTRGTLNDLFRLDLHLVAKDTTCERRVLKGEGRIGT
jgi:hypothetical protein